MKPSSPAAMYHCPQSLVCWWTPSSSSSSSPGLVFLISLIAFSTPLLSFSAASHSAPTPFAVGQITDSPKSGLNTTVLIATVAVSAVISLSLALISMVWFKCFRFRFSTRKNRVVNGDVESEIGSKSEEVGVRRLSWDEVKTLTNGFENVIDSGGFSVVYHGTLPSIDQTSSTSKSAFGAFKVHNSSERLNQGFREELSILLKLNHPNIVKLHGYCDDHERGALVFEYVQNGTLQENLHCSKAVHRSVQWGTRVSIAYQLALALDYLHEQCELHIVHGDIKSSNILLDSSFNVKLCDLGSATTGLAPLSRKILITGSPGYVDPHYLRTGISSKKNDIYSFGVVLMELLTGLEAFCSETGRMLTSRFGNGLGLVNPDPRLGGEYELNEWRVMGEIADMCLRGSPCLRPSAREVITIMQQNVTGTGL